ncbi:hypothetical protein [Serratia symbiotica]|uniref:hypothetical protein n=1 Tax=Serratia symbiotica TaxID=138074 RepID=UPI0034643B21
MRLSSKSIYDRAITFRKSFIFAVIAELLNFTFRAIIFRPLLIICCILLVLLTAIPVAVFISPSFTEPAAMAGVVRVAHLIPHMWPWLFMTGLMFELVSILHRLTGWPWQENTCGESGSGR